MLNLNNILVLTPKQAKIIASFGPLTVDHWKRNETTLRKSIRSTLKEMQKGLCVYCGCTVRDNGDVEHIVHKAAYPQFLFTPQNLAFSCKACNQTYKGDKNIVSAPGTSYDTYQFKIVHPYIDDVDHFFDTTKFRIQIRPGLNCAEQKRAKATCELLHWEDTEVVFRRATETMAQMYAEEHGINISEEIINSTLVYKPIEME